MRIFQIGAAGGVGRRLAPLLIADGHEVAGMHRRPEQADTITATGATPVVGDLIADSVDQLADKFRGYDAVVFSAGAHGTGPEQTTLIDGEGLKKSADAAALAGVERFVLVSVIPDAGRDQQPNPGFEHYMRVKKQADAYLVQTNLDWIIVRPGTLTDPAGSGHVTAAAAVDYGDVARDNVAGFIAAALFSDLHREIIELVDGETPLADAVDALVELRKL